MKDGRIRPRTAALTARQLLERWIARSRMTQAEAADQIGVSPVSLNQWLMGEKGPSLAMAVRIEDATGIPVRAWLTDGSSVNRLTDTTRKADGKPFAIQ